MFCPLFGKGICIGMGTREQLDILLYSLNESGKENTTCWSIIENLYWETKMMYVISNKNGLRWYLYLADASQIACKFAGSWVGSMKIWGNDHLNKKYLEHALSLYLCGYSFSYHFNFSWQ